MYNLRPSFLMIVFIHLTMMLHAQIKDDTRNILFNRNWLFLKADLSDGPESPSFDDSSWRKIDLPHDWSIETLPGEDSENQVGPFKKDKTFGGRINGWAQGGTGWYRKHFKLDGKDAGKSVVLKFDGVYEQAEVWVNGTLVGKNNYGYTPFGIDITPQLKPAGEQNLVAVKVANLGENARWYSGSGIYRNVELLVTDPLHVSLWGVQVTSPFIEKELADIEVRVAVQNDEIAGQKGKIILAVYSPDGRKIAEDKTQQVFAGKNSTVLVRKLSVAKPLLWTLSSPNLYTLKVIVMKGSKSVDHYQQQFGIRSLEFSASKGFLLNGQPILLKGGAVHHDNGLLGSKAINRAEERRVEILKAAGFNAIRCSHNPPSEAFLDACDRIGMLVIDEFTDVWNISKVDDDYSTIFKANWKNDLKNMMLRDRNHPSIIMWSIGNEIPEAGEPSGFDTAKELVEEVRKYDTTRAITEAHVDIRKMMGLESDWTERAPHMGLLDVVGYNYDYEKYEIDHKKFPERIIYGSESYPRDVFEYWTAVENDPWVIGDFVWTAMDYYGESGIGKSLYIDKNGVVRPTERPHLPANLKPLFMDPSKKAKDGKPMSKEYAEGALASISSPWPWFNAWCGDVDITGEAKPQKAYKDVLWGISDLEMNVHSPVPQGKREVVSLWGWPDEWPHWSWHGSEGDTLQVRVFTKATEVRLELNGKRVGTKELTAIDKDIAVFDVPYQPGELKAIAFSEGKEIGTRVFRTAGAAPYQVRLTADRTQIGAGRNGLSFVKAEVIDKNGVVVPSDSIKIKFTVFGVGELAACGNANPTDMESVNGEFVKTFKGKAQAILRPLGKTGGMTLKAESENLIPGEITVIVKD